MLFNPLENSTKKKLLPNCKVRKQSQSLNKCPKQKQKQILDSIHILYTTLGCFLPPLTYSRFRTNKIDACKSMLL